MPVAICLMGPTAAGKTGVAVSLSLRFPVDVISVDSALVYRGMDIGTAKPDAATLARVPHRLIDIRDPTESYSAGDFVRDATAGINAIVADGRIPLLVGGTMLYFRALIDGMAELPPAYPDLRASLDAEAERVGWPALHQRLRTVDAEAASRIDPNDRQRIQRALEVYQATGTPLSEWQRQTPARAGIGDMRFVKLALLPGSRQELHRRIASRFDAMIEAGFADEIDRLMAHPGLTLRHPSMRAVGYRQLWAWRSGKCNFEDARSRALAATRQLAKRQLTWLRSEQDIISFDALEAGAVDAISARVAVALGAKAHRVRNGL